ncbi:MAG TPA: urease accessory protein UreF [Xanthobacteraceae bacterium]|nr:urease accessory protein UreF [Xanthobacteraceae bacterium]
MTSDPSGVLPLFIWLSPAFPVGSYAYSHGLEWVVEAADIHDADSCADWIADLVAHGGGWSDAVLLACAYRAVSTEQRASLAAVAELARALAPSRERRVETLNQGEAFLRAVRSAWPSPALDRAAAALGDQSPFPIVVGATAAAHGIQLAPTLQAYLAAFISNLVSAAVRLIPLGQTDGTRISARLAPLVYETAARAASSSLRDVGGAAFRSDIASMRHETQYTRLFRS